MDFHAHLSNYEIIRLLGARWDSDRKAFGFTQHLRHRKYAAVLLTLVTPAGAPYYGLPCAPEQL